MAAGIQFPNVGAVNRSKPKIRFLASAQQLLWHTVLPQRPHGKFEVVYFVTNTAAIALLYTLFPSMFASCVQKYHLRE